MKCPKCGIETVIMSTGTDITGDKSPDTQTVVWAVQVHQCRNTGCGECGKNVGETRHRIFPEENSLKGGDENE